MKQIRFKDEVGRTYTTIIGMDDLRATVEGGNVIVGDKEVPADIIQVRLSDPKTLRHIERSVTYQGSCVDVNDPFESIVLAITETDVTFNSESIYTQEEEPVVEEVVVEEVVVEEPVAEEPEEPTVVEEPKVEEPEVVPEPVVESEKFCDGELISMSIPANHQPKSITIGSGKFAKGVSFGGRSALVNTPIAPQRAVNPYSSIMQNAKVLQLSPEEPLVTNPVVLEETWKNKVAKFDTPVVTPKPAPYIPEIKAEPEVTAEQKDAINVAAEAERIERKKNAKIEFRKKVDPEIANVIGDIPTEMLGTVDAFSTNVIDIEVVKEKGAIYCLDHRWKKQGNWFCVDIIPNNSRIFFNAKLNVCIEISTKLLREWLNITEM